MNMRSPLVPIALGCTLVFGSVFANLYQRRQHDEDLRDIHLLQQRVDSVKAVLAQARSSIDSTRLREEIRAREEGIGSREYHVGRRQAQLDRWWKLTGPGSLTGALGLALVLLGWRYSQRKRQGAA